MPLSEEQKRILAERLGRAIDQNAAAKEADATAAKGETDPDVEAFLETVTPPIQTPSEKKA